MTLFADAVADMDAALLDIFGVTATHANGTFAVVLDKAYDEQGLVETRYQTVFCRQADLPAGLKIGDSLAIGGNSYRITAPQPDPDGGGTVLTLERLS